MRAAFTASLVELAERDPRIVLLTGDMGFAVLEPFQERFPDRFLNVGVAEQNMLGLATGLAEAGHVPFTYSIATFASLRPYEFLRNGPALHELPVRLVGIGGAFDYGPNGISHFALEDVGVMRLQPNVTVVVPADAAQTRPAVEALEAVPGAVYLRLGKRADAVPGLDGRFRMGRAEMIGDGTDVAIVAIGTVAAEAVRAAELLADEGLDATVAIVSSFNPAPEDDLAALLETVPLAVTVEAHYATGGLGSFVAELVAERGLGARLVRCGVTTMPSGSVGSTAFLQERHGLTAEAVADRSLAALRPVGG
ncbi:MAG TPA: transketolase C-terminal domain-containing protein [Solirubrobacteraceae bacterium]|jgi:transketolase|nr:transketolase C-terminal domain-containing protein [Solirubrobacteraceae bacterium]